MKNGHPGHLAVPLASQWRYALKVSTPLCFEFTSSLCLHRNGAVFSGFVKTLRQKA